MNNMTLKEFEDKIIKLKQDNPKISNCIIEDYYLKSFNDKDNNFKPCLFFYFDDKENYKMSSIYDLSDYMSKEIKEIKYDDRLKKNIVYIESVVIGNVKS